MAVKPSKNGVVAGTKNNDKITWSNSKDWKKALTVNSLDGADIINFSKSTYKNKLNGGNGNDVIYGGSNIDIIHGDNDNDVLYGNNGDDQLYGDNGNDKIYGGNGNDLLSGGNGDDLLVGGKGNDRLYTNSGNNTVTFNIGDGADTLFKGNGEDTLFFSNFANINALKSGISVQKLGNDLKLIYTKSDSVLIKDYFRSGTSVVNLKAKNGEIINLPSFLNIKTFSFNGDANKANTINGTIYNDIIKGGAKNDVLNGGSGNDKLYGNAGADVLNGGNGNDMLTGGAGNDRIYTGAGVNSVIINKGDGNDIIYHQGTRTTVKIVGANAKDGMSFTKSGNNLLLTYTHVKAKTDKTNVKEVVTFANYFNPDGTVRDDEIYLQTTQTQKVSAFIGSKGLNISGAGTINGTNFNDILTGSTGADVMSGGVGNDILKGGNANDVLNGGSGNDVLYGEAGNDRINGNDGNDRIYGGVGNDTINAGSGVNTLYFAKGDGNDNVVSGGGVDTLVFTSETNINRITAQYIGDDLRLNYTGGTVTLKDYNNSHSAKYIQVGNIKKSIEDILPEPEYLKIDGYSIIQGTNEADELKGTRGADKIFGCKGNDTISGGSGDDCLYGGAGDDTITGGQGSDWLFGGNGKNKFYFSTGDGNDYFNEHGMDNTFVFKDISNLNSLQFETIKGSVDGQYDDEYGIRHYLYKYDLKITYSSTGDSITIPSFFSTSHYDYSKLKFQAGENGEPVTLYSILKESEDICPQDTFFPGGFEEVETTFNLNQGAFVEFNEEKYNGKDLTITGYGNIHTNSGNDKIYVTTENADLGDQSSVSWIYTSAGNDIIDMTGLAERESERQWVSLDNTEGINTLRCVVEKVVDDETQYVLNAPIGITLDYRIESKFAKSNTRAIEERWGDDANEMSITAFRKGDNLIIANNSLQGIYGGTLIIEDYYKLSAEEQAKISVAFYPVEYHDNYEPRVSYFMPDFLTHILNNENYIPVDINNLNNPDLQNEVSNTKRFKTDWFNLINNTGANGEATIIGNNEKANYIVGGENALSITGGNSHDVIYAGDITGHDENGNFIESEKMTGVTITAGGGHDYVIGSSGNDLINGTKGQNYINGGSGNDTIIGGDLTELNNNYGYYKYVNNELIGGKGNDVIYSVTENQSYQGGSTYFKNYIEGNEGNDTIYANGYSDEVHAGSGDDEIHSWKNTLDSTSEIYGDDGDNKIYLYGDGYQRVEVGDGNNIIDASNSTGMNGINVGNGNNTITGGDGVDRIITGFGVNTIDAGGGNDEIEVWGDGSTVNGGAGNDIITAYGNTTVNGGAGNDTIYISNGDKHSVSNLTINGGDGNDTYVVNPWGDSNYDTIVASKGRDIIKFAGYTGAQHKRNGNDLVIIYKHKDPNYDYSQTSSLTLKDYYNGADFSQFKVQTFEDTFCNTRTGNYSLNDFIKFLDGTYVPPAKTNFELANMVMGTDGDDTLTQTYNYNYPTYDNQKNILVDEYGASQEWIDKYTADLSAKANIVSSEYENVRNSLSNIKWYEYLISNYDNPDYTGDTYFRRWSKEHWEDSLAQENARAYGVRYTWENYRDTQLEAGADLEDLYYSIEYARFKNTADALAKYQGYADGSLNVPTFRDIAIAQGYTQENGFQYWENKATSVLRNIEGFTGTKEAYETLLNAYADEHAEFKTLMTNYKNDPETYAQDYEDALEEILENNEEIKTAYDTYQAGLAKYNLYLEYSRNYYDPEYLGKGYISTIDGKEYVSFRQEAEAESQNKVIHDYMQGKYRYRTGQEYWAYRAEMLNREINGYEGADARYEYFYRLSGEGNPLSRYYDLLREARDEYNDYVDEYNTYVRYNNNWNNDAYIGESGDDATRDVDYWGGRALLTNNELNGDIYVYNNKLNELNELIQYIKDNAPSDEALQILTHLTTDGQGGIVIAGDGNDDITLAKIDPNAEYPYYGMVFAMGQGGNDTYRIDTYSKEHYSVQIHDHEGSNTVYLNDTALKSGNIGIYANVTLEKDGNGEYIKDEHGNYQFTLTNFNTYLGNSSGFWSCMERSPLKDGDAGYALLIVDAETYRGLYTFSYGAMDQNGIKLDGETVNHLDMIYAQDGKYITQAQLNAMFQKTANKLAEMGYDSFMDAMCIDGIENEYQNMQNNLYQLTSSEYLGSLEWINPDEGIIEGVSDGLIGTNTNDTLTSSAADETFDLKLGNDTITFTGEFGNDIIQSSSTKDNKDNARQSDTLNLADYSVSDGSLKFSTNGNDLILTAYDDGGITEKGKITYKDFLNGEDYNSRKFVLNAKDHTYMVWFNEAQERAEESNVVTLDLEDWNNPDYNIRFIKSLDNGIVRIYANENGGTYRILDDTPIVLYPKDGKTIEIFSDGNGDDYYPIRLNEDTNVVIHDGGGNDTIEMDGGWSEIIGDAKMRFFFDMNDEGVVSDAKHIIWTDNFYIPGVDINGDATHYYATDNLLKLLNNDFDHEKGVITFYGDIENIKNNNHPSALYNYPLNYNKIVASTAIDIVPWLKENGYESVKDALTQLKTQIDAKQEEMNGVDLSGYDKEHPETMPEEYAILKNEKDALQAKVNELLGFYNENYENILYTNMLGTNADDIIIASMAGRTKYIEAKEGNDTIDLTTSHSNVKLVYNFARGDGHDTVINAMRTLGGDGDKLHIYVGKLNMTPKFRADGWDLILEMYADSEATQNPDGSIRFKNYFYNKYSRNVDTIIVHSLDNNDEEVIGDPLSISEMLVDQGVINPDVTLYTNNNDNITGTNGNDIIYTGGSLEGEYDIITSSAGNDTYYLTATDDNYASDRYRRVNFSYTVGCGDDTIYGADYVTHLTLNYNNEDISMEFRKTDNNDIRLVFFNYEGQERGSITIKESDISWAADGSIYTGYGSSFLSHNNTDTFFIKKNDEDPGTAYKLKDLVKQYADMGGSMVENNDNPYIRNIKIDNDTPDGYQITNTGKIDRIIFSDDYNAVESALSGNDLVLTYGVGKTVVVKGFVTGASNVYDVYVNGDYTTLRDLSGFYYGTTGNDTFIHSTEADIVRTYNLNTGNDTVEFPATRNAYDAYENNTLLYNKAIINSQGGSNYTDTIKLNDYNFYTINNYNSQKLRFGFADDGNGITIKGEKDFNPTSLVNYHKYTDITYNNFMNGISPELTVQISAGDYNNEHYNLHRYNTVQNLDTSNSYEYVENTSNVIFISAASGTSKITSGSYSGTQILTNGGASLNFTGHDGDIIVTNSTSSNDIYNVDYTSSAKLFITDKGGTNDILNLQDMSADNMQNLFLSFNVNLDGTTDNKIAISYGIGEGTLYNRLKSLQTDKIDLVSGTVVIDAAKQNGKNVGIEHVYGCSTNWSQARNDENGFHIAPTTRLAEIDMESWYSAVKQEVLEWMTTNADWMAENHLTSTADVFNIYTTIPANDAKYNELVSIYESHNASQYLMNV